MEVNDTESSSRSNCLVSVASRWIQQPVSTTVADCCDVRCDGIFVAECTHRISGSWRGKNSLQTSMMSPIVDWLLSHRAAISWCLFNFFRWSFRFSRTIFQIAIQKQKTPDKDESKISRADEHVTVYSAATRSTCEIHLQASRRTKTSLRFHTFQSVKCDGKRIPYVTSIVKRNRWHSPNRDDDMSCCSTSQSLFIFNGRRRRCR